MLASLFRETRAAWRLSCVAWLILRGTIMVRVFFPYWSEARRRTLKQSWSRRLVAVLGVKVDACEASLPASTLIVSNHISWLDVFIINAITPTTFVCKDEVKDWPGIGGLVEYSGTLFIARGSRTAAARSAQAMAARLSFDERVVVFPEGTTTQGTSMLPFRAALFQAAIDAQVPVQPACLRYRDAQGQISLAPAYDGDITFVQCILAIARASGLRAELKFLAPLPASHSRRDLARLSETAIACELGLSLDPGALVIDAEERTEDGALPAEEPRAA